MIRYRHLSRACCRAFNACRLRDAERESAGLIFDFGIAGLAFRQDPRLVYGRLQLGAESGEPAESPYRVRKLSTRPSPR